MRLRLALILATTFLLIAWVSPGPEEPEPLYFPGIQPRNFMFWPDKYLWGIYHWDCGLGVGHYCKYLVAVDEYYAKTVLGVDDAYCDDQCYWLRFEDTPGDGRPTVAKVVSEVEWPSSEMKPVEFRFDVRYCGGDRFRSLLAFRIVDGNGNVLATLGSFRPKRATGWCDRWQHAEIIQLWNRDLSFLADRSDLALSIEAQIEEGDNALIEVDNVYIIMGPLSYSG